jgi:hypothetical protein
MIKHKTICPHCQRALELEVFVNKTPIGIKMTAERKKQLVKLARMGWNDDALAEEFNISRKYVVAIRTNGGVKFTTNGALIKEGTNG